MQPYVMIGHSAFFGDYVDAIHSIGGYPRKVVYNFPPDAGTGKNLRARAAFSRGEMEESLHRLMAGFLHTQLTAPRGVPLPAGWPEADELTLGIAGILGQGDPPPATPDLPENTRTR